MSYEDFTTYTEVDTANNRVQRTATHVDHAATRNEDTYLYKDYGVGHFTDFTHKVDVRSDFAALSSQGFVWMLANDVDDAYGLHSAGKTFILIRIRRDDAGNHITLFEFYGGDWYYDDYVGVAANTWYYLTIEKSGTSLTCKIYSDSARTTLVDTLSLTLHGNWSFRYIYACNTWNDGAGTYLVAYEVSVAEKLGLADSIAKRVDYGTVLSGAEKLGLTDSITPKWSAHVTIAEALGLIDAVMKVKASHVTAAEKLGMIDDVLKSVSRARGVHVATAEVLGLVDKFKTRKVRIGDLPDHTLRGGA